MTFNVALWDIWNDSCCVVICKAKMFLTRGIISAWSIQKHCSSRFDYSPRGFIHIQLPVHRLLLLGVSSLILPTPFGRTFQLLECRVTSHMSQEPWPCNGEDPWLSSKGRTMGVGKAVLCSRGSSSTVWSESGPCCRTIAYFVGNKRGEGLVQYNMSQTLPIQGNYLVVLVCPRICYKIYLAIYHTRKNIKKNQKMGLMQILGDYGTLSIVRHVGLHIDFSFMKSSLDL
jgi:hypothetical protein